MKRINVLSDGIYMFTGLVSEQLTSTFYFRGDPPSGSVTFGVIDDDGVFLPFEDGMSDINISFRHGYGAILAINVVGFSGTLTQVYMAG